MSGTTSFDNDLALKYGVNEAIILNNLQYWVRLNKCNKSEKNFVDGKYWTYQTYDALHNIFHYWSLKTIQRTIASMVNQGLIIVAQHKKSQHDRTNWYTLTDEMWSYFEPKNLSNSTMTDKDTRTGQNDLLHDDNLTSSEQDNMSNSYLNSHNQSKPYNHIIPNPLKGHGNVNAVPVPQNAVRPNLKINVSTDARELAHQAWLTMIATRKISFTKFELAAIKAYAYSKPHLPPHEIDSCISLLEKWALEGKDIEDCLRQSLSTRTLIKPTMRIEHDSRKNRIYDPEQLNFIRQQQINQEKE